MIQAAEKKHAELHAQATAALEAAAAQMESERATSGAKVTALEAQLEALKLQLGSKQSLIEQQVQLAKSAAHTVSSAAVQQVNTRMAVCGSNGFDTEPCDGPNEPHSRPPGGLPSAFNRGSSTEPSIETLRRVHTRTSVCEGFQRATLIRVLEQVAELKEIAQTETEAVRAQLSAAHERELTKVRDEAAAAMERLQEEAEVSGRAPLTRALLLHFSDVLCWDNISLRVPSQETLPSASPHDV